jgi:rhodanese-related sulfurtransferase
MIKTRTIMFLFGFLFLSSTSVMAQFTVIDAGQLRSYLTGKKNAVLVDTRTPEEYQQTHIPGAINIEPDEMKAKAARLLKDKAAPIIFYCRGMD